MFYLLRPTYLGLDSEHMKKLFYYLSNGLYGWLNRVLNKQINKQIAECRSSAFDKHL